ncbi:hypothetical protein JNUCC1_02986 [Lentibacillus sp. JNUCC-1]|uniref:glutaredoxin family protein n=1 Tax=Lentibacillus sp. JNUCC-1 TaxID=2654513 RepID=UPI0012E84698|nr:glutaredoxin family protein [Lentibacillus sp. JNUCC-1]MUV39113.1 hypothetical protein [Lentibacillus sp. JNUCC-1]
MKVLFYTKDHCSLCDDAMAFLYMLERDFHFDIEERDIYTNDTWLAEYQLRIPVVEVNGEQLDCEGMSYEALADLLKRAAHE